ncbi:hypothetical protein N5P37_003601 [Trichoderma harzianum]|nr:hypothetical protein N5P37_003601 [Trichoderma harzianum]PKK45127.1 hypothetical protein CI102_10639 [Trichoderma harzianum]
MTPDEQQKYVDMVRNSDYILSPSNRATPSNNKLWKYLKDPENVYSRAHFVMLAAAYGISRLSHLRENVEAAGDVFEIMDYSEYYDHFYHHSTPSPTEDGSASAVATPAHGLTLVDETRSTGATPINQPVTPPPNEPQFAPAAPPLRARQAWDPFQSSPATIAARSPPSEAPVEPNSASVQPTVGLLATTRISIPSTTPEPQPKSSTYSPQLNPTLNANEGRYSPSIEIAALRERIRTLENEKAALLQLVRDQAVALNQRQQ